MKNMYDFLKSKLKEKNMRIETFIRKTDVSKSTIYRVMKGYQKPSEELLLKMTEVLSLSLTEEQEFRYYSSLMNADEEILFAREAVFDLLYKPDLTTPSKFEVVYYDDEKYIRTFDKVLQNIVKEAENEEFSIKVRIVNCYQESVTKPLYTLASEMVKLGKKHKIEHLINLSTFNSKENISILHEIIVLLSLDFYSVFYCETEGVAGNGIFSDFIMIDYQFRTVSGEMETKRLYISVLKENLSACLVVKDENLQEFFERSFETLQHDYRAALTLEKKHEFIGGLWLDQEENHEVYFFKPNPCYQRVPIAVYQHLKERVSLFDFVSSYFQSQITAENYEAYLEQLLVFMTKRMKASYKNRQIDILTQSGMEALASTGMLSDPWKDFPAFSKEEIKMILESLKERDADKNDPFNFYILKDGYSNDDITVYACKDSLVEFEYNKEKYVYNSIPFCVLEHKGLSNIFADFAENYVPNMLALSTVDAYAFIDALIEKYC